MCGKDCSILKSCIKGLNAAAEGIVEERLTLTAIPKQLPPLVKV